jgi:enterochelin esterase-like enzyme
MISNLYKYLETQKFFMKYFCLFFLLSALVVLKVPAASVDTILVHSTSMNKELKCVVIKPDRYEIKSLRFPVIYLLQAISGLSMGGHGALFIAFRHADVFGACGSISGAVDLASVKNKFELSQRIGDTVKFTANWKNYSVLNIIEKKPSQPLAVMIDCGWDDYFFASHKKLHEKMLRLRIAHDYVERPGKHEWPYWVNAIEYQLLFFSKYFSRYVK